MEQLMDTEEEMRPNAIIYNTLINAYSKSSDPKKTEKVEAILQKMIQMSEHGHIASSPTHTCILQCNFECLFQDKRKGYV